MVVRNQPGFNHVLLYEARTARGYTQKDIAQKLAITRQAFSAYETGATVPKTEMVTMIAEELNFPFEYFYGDAQHVDTGPIFFRRNRTAHERTRDAIATRIRWLMRVFMHYSLQLEFPVLNIDRKFDEEYSNEEIEHITQNIRCRWKLGLGPIGNVINVLENNGFVISRFSLNLKGADACSAINDSLGDLRSYVCSIDQRDGVEISAVRDRFSNVHEAAHAFLHSGHSPEYIEMNERQLEDEADYFASAFLLPKDTFGREALFMTNVMSFVELKSRWKVSVQAMIRRCRDLELISPSTHKYLSQQVGFRRWRVREPLDDSIPKESPALLKNATEFLLEEQIKTKSEILEDVNIPASDLEALLGVEPDYFWDKGNDNKIVIFPKSRALNPA